MIIIALNIKEITYIRQTDYLYPVQDKILFYYINKALNSINKTYCLLII